MVVWLNSLKVLFILAAFIGKCGMCEGGAETNSLGQGLSVAETG